ncbi:hypothetical protein GN156_30560, partial [bacterium LRH843]|nr:hypothetical protein [bacterium LRH843]
FDEKKGAKLRKFATRRREQIEKDYQDLVEEVAYLIEQEGHFSPELNDASQPDKAFIRNLYLLGKLDDNMWLPFWRDDTCYLIEKRRFY